MSATDLAREPRAAASRPAPVWVAALEQRGSRGEGRFHVVVPGAVPPAAADASDLHVVVDGQLHNRRELAALGGASEDADDAAVLLHAYRRSGPAVVSRLRGRFAALIWDGKREELLAIRDPVGAYPLFYGQAGDRLLLSTGLEDLVSQPGISSALDRVVLAERLCHRWPDVESTHYTAVRRLPPGHYLAVGGAGRRLERYWDPVPGPEPEAWLKEDELEEFDDVMERAIERCLALGPAGIYLSGGLDSVSVAAVAGRMTQDRGLRQPLALSLAFPDPECNEEERQRQVAERLGMPQVILGYDEAIGHRPRLLAALEEGKAMPDPLVALWLPAYMRLAEEGRRQGCRVIMTGGGGDELLGISPFRAADLIASGRIGDLWRLFRGLQRSFHTSPFRSGRSLFWKHGLRPIAAGSAQRALNAVAPSVLRARWRRQLEAGRPSWLTTDAALERDLWARGERMIEESMTSSGFYDRQLREGLDHPTISAGKEGSFEEGRFAGLSIVAPYWDPEMVEFLYRVPPELLHHGGRTKGLVRGMLGRRFPGLGFEHQRKILAVDFAKGIFASESRAAFAALDGIQALAQLELVNPARFEREVAQLAAGQSDRKGLTRVWDVFAMEAWLRPRL